MSPETVDLNVGSAADESSQESTVFYLYSCTDVENGTETLQTLRITEVCF